MQTKTSSKHPTVAAVIAAAGQSRRMGQPKQLLPWGDQTVIEAVVNNLAAAGVSPIVCVVGRNAQEVGDQLSNASVHTVYNTAYFRREMLYSFQLGLKHLNAICSETTQPLCAGTLFSLGDQPHVSAYVIEKIVAQVRQTPRRIVVPSYQMRRGHPFFIPRSLWPQILDLGPADTLRSVVQQHAQSIAYVNLTTDSVLTDIDTPADYARLLDQWVAKCGEK